MSTVDIIIPAYGGFPVSPRTMESAQAARTMTSGVGYAVCMDGDNLPQCRNNAIALSAADYILPLDADDWLVPGAVAALRQALDGHPGCAVAYGDWYEVYEEHGACDLARARDWTRENVAHNVVACYSIMFRRMAWERLGGYDETMLIAEDWEFQARLIDANALAVRLHTPTLYHLNRSGSKWRKDLEQWGQRGLMDELRQRVPGIFD